jgi:hypothetical protein
MTAFDKFEEYKLFVDDTARFSERRQTVTNTYISINGVILGFIAFLVKDAGLTNWWLVVTMLPLIIAGTAVCIFWRQFIYKYKSLVKLRIDALRTLETQMPGSIQMYHKEDELYPRNAQGETIGSSLGISNLEASLPIVFIVLYIVFGVGLALATWLVLAGLLPAPVVKP